MPWITVSTDEMAMIADPHMGRRKFLVNVTPRCATVRLALFFRQCFHGHVGGYDIFHSMRQIIELSCEPRYTVFIATEMTDMTITRRRTNIVRSTLY